MGAAVNALRPYQREALEAIGREHGAGVVRQLVALPTGTGKTVVFAALPEAGFRRLLVLAHREELLGQAAEKIARWNPGLSVAIDRAEERPPVPTGDAFAVVASVATIGRRGSPRLTRYPADTFEAVVVDEAHHATAASYGAVLDHFSGRRLLLGVTATPFRADESDLSAVFDQITFSRSLPDMIEAGFLVAVRAVSVRTDVDLDGVRANRDDFLAGSLAETVNTEGRNAQVVRAYLDLASSRKALVFAAGVQHSKDLAATFRAAGVEAEHLDGETPREERAAIVRRLRTGETVVLCNCGVLTEGFDEPTVSAVILARPTKSPVLYVQMIGRGTRLAPGKDDLLILDVVDVTSRHSLVSAPRVFGLPAALDLEGRNVLEVKAEVDQLLEDGVLPIEELGRAAKLSDIKAAANRYRDVLLFWKPERAPEVAGLSVQPWASIGGGAVVLRIGDRRAVVATDILGGGRVSLTRRAGGVDEVLASLYRPTFAEAVLEAEARLIDGAPRALADPNARWRSDPASEKQLAALRKFRVPTRPNLTKGDAGILLEKAFARVRAR